jgi:hypothetical protein
VRFAAALLTRMNLLLHLPPQTLNSQIVMKLGMKAMSLEASSCWLLFPEMNT